MGYDGYGNGLGGFGGGFGAPWCPKPCPKPVAPVAPRGNGFALIVVLFILLIIIGATSCA